MVITGKGLTTHLDLRKKSKQEKNAIFDITDITRQDFSNLIKKFKILPYLGYKSKQVHNETNED